MSEERQSLLNRLKRIEGQVRGISKMISEEQDCAEILMQIAAVKAAVNKVGTLVLQTHFRHCLEKALKEGTTDYVADVMELLDKYIS